MPTISDYNSLSTAILQFGHRQDLNAYVDYFIQGAQEQIQNDIFEQNFGNGVMGQENAYSQVITNGVTPVPSDWLAPKFFTVTDGSGFTGTLEFKDPEWLYDAYPLRQPQGLPAYVARDGANFIYGPFPDSAYTIGGAYYQQATLLSTQNSTNWMVLNCPHALLAACMIEAGKFTVDDALIARWMPLYQQRLKSLVDADKAERFSAGTLQIELG